MLPPTLDKVLQLLETYSSPIPCRRVVATRGATDADGAEEEDLREWAVQEGVALLTVKKPTHFAELNPYMALN